MKSITKLLYLEHYSLSCVYIGSVTLQEIKCEQSHMSCYSNKNRYISACIHKGTFTIGSTHRGCVRARVCVVCVNVVSYIPVLRYTCPGACRRHLGHLFSWYTFGWSGAGRARLRGEGGGGDV